MALFSKSDTVDVGVVFRLVSSQAIHKKYANPKRHPRPIVQRFHWSFFRSNSISRQPARRNLSARRENTPISCKQMVENRYPVARAMIIIARRISAALFFIFLPSFEIDVQSKGPAAKTADPFGFNTCWIALKLLF